jgi:hypothetical protein
MVDGWVRRRCSVSLVHVGPCYHGPHASEAKLILFLGGPPQLWFPFSFGPPWMVMFCPAAAWPLRPCSTPSHSTPRARPSRYRAASDSTRRRLHCRSGGSSLRFGRPAARSYDQASVSGVASTASALGPGCPILFLPSPPCTIFVSYSVRFCFLTPRFDCLIVM